MPKISSQNAFQLMSNTNNIRNFCIVAHVDHGKTTVSDALIASNAIISTRLAGELRYLDSREDEQRRGITMKSSVISLVYSFSKPRDQGARVDEEYLMNLLDSPGHVDFAGEVSTALRISDGALVVVDSVEGVCPQTVTVLKHVFMEHVTPILLFNKLDKLIVELKMTPAEAYVHLSKILEQVNAVVAMLANESRFSKNKASESDLSDKIILSSYFSPEKGNVLFGSGYDNWAFNLRTFACLWAEKLKCSRKVLLKTLWGDFYYDSKSRKIMKGAFSKSKTSLFELFILKSIWNIYSSFFSRNAERLQKAVASLKLRVTPGDYKSRKYLRAIMSQWLPMHEAVFDMFVRYVPSPAAVGKRVLENFRLTRDLTGSFGEACGLIDALETCDPESGHVVAFVSKLERFSPDGWLEARANTKNVIMFDPQSAQEARKRYRDRIQRELHDENKPVFTEAHPETHSEEESFIEDTRKLLAYTRVYSGTLSVGQSVHVLGPKYDPSNVVSFRTEETVEAIFIIMGSEFIPVASAPAGCIVAVSGLNSILKTATLSSSLYCPPLSPLHFEASPIVTVAVEPLSLLDMPKLIKGLQLLHQADSLAEFEHSVRGELLLRAAGQVHLEQCLKDLEEDYAKCSIRKSDPIVSFRETLVHPPKSDMTGEVIDYKNLSTFEKKEKEESAELWLLNKTLFIKITALPLPKKVVELINSQLSSLNGYKPFDYQKDGAFLKKFMIGWWVHHELRDFRSHLQLAFSEDSDYDWPLNVIHRILAFGPNNNGPNVLLNQSLLQPHTSGEWAASQPMLNSIKFGFQIATNHGPLCEEPMRGVCFVINAFTYDSSIEKSSCGPIGGTLINASKDLCRKAFLRGHPRLMQAVYSCEIHAQAEVLGKIYSVISKRAGQVYSEEMKEGTSLFLVKCYLPVINSFGFVEEIRKKASGSANPQLVLDHWQILPIDPFWTPSTEEELILFGKKFDGENIARKYMNDVRRRKGLPVEEKLVEHAEKQRTLKKNK